MSFEVFIRELGAVVASLCQCEALTFPEIDYVVQYETWNTLNAMPELKPTTLVDLAETILLVDNVRGLM